MPVRCCFPNRPSCWYNPTHLWATVWPVHLRDDRGGDWHAELDRILDTDASGRRTAGGNGPGRQKGRGKGSPEGCPHCCRKSSRRRNQEIRRLGTRGRPERWSTRCCLPPGRRQDRRQATRTAQGDQAHPFAEPARDRGHRRRTGINRRTGWARATSPGKDQGHRRRTGPPQGTCQPPVPQRLRHRRDRRWSEAPLRIEETQETLHLGNQDQRGRNQVDQDRRGWPESDPGPRGRKAAGGDRRQASTRGPEDRNGNLGQEGHRVEKDIRRGRQGIDRSRQGIDRRRQGCRRRQDQGHSRRQGPDRRTGQGQGRQDRRRQEENRRGGEEGDGGQDRCRQGQHRRHQEGRRRQEES